MHIFNDFISNFSFSNINYITAENYRLKLTNFKEYKEI